MPPKACALAAHDQAVAVIFATGAYQVETLRALTSLSGLPWSRFSKSGVSGDPTLASAEKGKIIFEAVVNGFVRFVREFKKRERGQRTDYHRPAAT